MQLLPPERGDLLSVADLPNARTYRIEDVRLVHAYAGRRVLVGPVTIARSRWRRNPPAKRLGPEPGQSRQVVRAGGTRDVTRRETGMGNGPGWRARLGFCRVASTGAGGKRASGSTV